MMPSRPTEKMTASGLMRGVYDHPAQRAGGKRCSPTSIRSVNLNRSTPILLLTVLSGPALRYDQRNKRPSDRPQLLSWNPGPIRVRTRVCGQATSMARGMLTACRKALASATTSLCRKISTWLHSTAAPFLNRDTFESIYSCIPLFIPCKF